MFVGPVVWVFQAAARYSLMSPAQVVCRWIRWFVRIGVTFHQQPQNPGMVIDTDQGRPIRSHRSYRNRPSIVGVVLV
jgi:hypothetical protein